MKQVNIHEAKTTLSKLVARAEAGEAAVGHTPAVMGGCEEPTLAARHRILIAVMMHVSIGVMTRRVTANLPSDLLEKAMEVTGKGITETLIEGLARVRRGGAFDKAQSLRGRIKLEIDLEESRERRHR